MSFFKMRKSVIKLIHNHQIEIDTFEVESKNTNKYSYNKSFSKIDFNVKLKLKTLKDYNNLNYILHNNTWKRVDLNILLVYDNFDSAMAECIDVSVLQENRETLEYNLYVSSLLTYYDPKESLPYIRELQIKSIIDD